MSTLNIEIGLAVALALGFLGTGVASATPYVVKLTQQGGNVVASGSGTLDLDDLTSAGTGGLDEPSAWPSGGYLVIGSTGPIDFYTGFSGPTNFGSSIETLGSAGTGDSVGIIGNPAPLGDAEFFVPQGYVTETALTSGATWDNASFASLGITPGTYTWTWGTGADQSFTITTVTAVPEPAALGMFGVGLLLIGGFVGVRRRGAA